ncbi:MAG TPA: hypothetical protein V6C69_00600 [Trichormus sp.]
MGLFGSTKANDNLSDGAHAAIDPIALSKDMYTQEAHAEWSKSLAASRRGDATSLPVLLMNNDQPQGLAHGQAGFFPQAESPVMKQFHEQESKEFKPLEEEARHRIDKIVADMPESDRQAYEKELADYQKRMNEHMITGTLLSASPEPGPTMQRYQKMVDGAIQPLEQEKIAIDIRIRQSMPGVAKEEEEERRRAGTFL